MTSFMAEGVARKAAMPGPPPTLLRKRQKFCSRQSDICLWGDEGFTA